MTEGMKKFFDPAIPLVSGNSAAGVALGVGMGWQPGGDLDTEQLQQENVVITLHYPADPEETDFQVQFSLDQDFSDTTRTSDPTDTAVEFTVTGDVAVYSVDEFDSETGSNTYTFAEMPGQNVWVRVRYTGGPWSEVKAFHPYFPSHDDQMAASGLFG